MSAGAHIASTDRRCKALQARAGKNNKFALFFLQICAFIIFSVKVNLSFNIKPVRNGCGLIIRGTLVIFFHVDNKGYLRSCFACTAFICKEPEKCQSMLHM